MYIIIIDVENGVKKKKNLKEVRTEKRDSECWSWELCYIT